MIQSPEIGVGSGTREATFAHDFVASIVVGQLGAKGQSFLNGDGQIRFSSASDGINQHAYMTKRVVVGPVQRLLEFRAAEELTVFDAQLFPE